MSSTFTSRSALLAAAPSHMRRRMHAYEEEESLPLEALCSPLLLHTSSKVPATCHSKRDLSKQQKRPMEQQKRPIEQQKRPVKPVKAAKETCQSSKRGLLSKVLVTWRGRPSSRRLAIPHAAVVAALRGTAAAHELPPPHAP